MEKYKTQFGYFIRQARLDVNEYGIFITDAAKLLGITRKYLEELENGKKPAPDQALLRKMIEVYKLNDIGKEEEKELFFRLAEESQKNYARTVAMPLVDYQESVKEAFEVAIKYGATKKDLKEFSQKIKKRYKGREL